MGLCWLAALGYLCATAAIGTAAVVPDTYVVTKSDNVDDVTTPASTTTEEPLPPVKLLSMHVKSEVTLRYSRTSVTSLVKNPAKRSQETTFRILLPEKAFISGFSMTIEGKKYDAYVKEKEEAKQIYNDAVSHGIGAAQVATTARDSNHFTVNSNVEANSTATFNLIYEELLPLHNGFYNYVLNLHPGSTVNDLTVTVHIKEIQKITKLRVPEILTGNEIIPAEVESQNQLAEVTRSADGKEATVVFKPDINEQKRLMEIYEQKSKESLGYSQYPGNDESPTAGSLGQLVVQYDVDRSVSNQVLINDGYFVHFLAPTNITDLPKYVIFVMDLSGSMYGRKIEQLREAMQIILSELKKNDYFSFVTFESVVRVHNLKKTESISTTPVPYYFEQPQILTKLVPPLPATPDNIKKAKALAGNLTANGGTNIADALDVAISLVQRGVGWNESTYPDQQSGKDATESRELEKVVMNDNKQPEPMIIFLTDGEPTEGETNPKIIAKRVIEKNHGPRRAPIYSIAFGDYADNAFLRKMSLQNKGFSRHVYEAADSSLQLQDFYKQISSPLLKDVTFTYAPEQVKQNSLTKLNFDTYYANSEIVVAGRLEPSVEDLTTQVYGYHGFDEGFGRKRFEFRPVIIPIKKKEGYLPLERLWAYLTINQLLEERDAAEDQDKPVEEKSAPEKKALELALKYSFVTPLTSLVVVKPNDTTAVNAESVDKSFPGSAGFAPQSFGPILVPAFPAQPQAPSVGFGGYGPGSAGYPGQPGRPSLPGRPGPPLVNAAPSGPAAPRRPAVGNAFGFGGGNGGHGPGSALHPTTTPVPLSFSIVTEGPNPLLVYDGFEQYPWTRPYLQPHTDELVFPVNGTDIHLKLTRHKDVVQTLGEEACSHATDGSATGSCVYLINCEAARNITIETYEKTYCSLNSYAGVCCPLYSITTLQSAFIQE